MLFGSCIDLLDPQPSEISFPILPVSVSILHGSLSLLTGYPNAIFGSAPATSHSGSQPFRIEMLIMMSLE